MRREQGPRFTVPVKRRGDFRYRIERVIGARREKRKFSS